MKDDEKEPIDVEATEVSSEARDTEPTPPEGWTAKEREGVAHVAREYEKAFGTDVTVTEVAPGVTVVGPAGKPVPGNIDDLLRQLGLNVGSAGDCDIGPDGVCRNHGAPRMSRVASALATYIDIRSEQAEVIRKELDFLAGQPEWPSELADSLRSVLSAMEDAALRAGALLSARLDAELAGVDYDGPSAGDN